jgi:hypothetical protein
MPKFIPFTEAQKQAAKQTDLATFLESRGEQLKRSGSEYEWVGHHITIRGNQFYDQYAQKGGKPRHAHQKSTSLNDSSFRANQTGSEAAFSFHHICGNCGCCTGTMSRQIRPNLGNLSSVKSWIG